MLKNTVVSNYTVFSSNQAEWGIFFITHLNIEEYGC